MDDGRLDLLGRDKYRVAHRRFDHAASAFGKRNSKVECERLSYWEEMGVRVLAGDVAKWLKRSKISRVAG